MGGYFVNVGFAAFLLVVISEYGWPPIELFDPLLRTEKSRRIAGIVIWVLTAAWIANIGYRLWSSLG